MRPYHHSKMRDKMRNISRKFEEIATFAKGSKIEATAKAYKLQFRLQAIPRLVGYGQLNHQLRNEIHEQNDKH